MRQIAFRDFRLHGAKALGKLRPGDAVILSGRQGPAYFLIRNQRPPRNGELLEPAGAPGHQHPGLRRPHARSPAHLVDRILRRELAMMLCPGILRKYLEVMQRPKFAKAGFPPGWLDQLLGMATRLPRNSWRS
jgi:hypothetical protein